MQWRGLKATMHVGQSVTNGSNAAFLAHQRDDAWCSKQLGAGVLPEAVMTRALLA
jgi:hypothetical protein